MGPTENIFVRRRQSYNPKMDSPQKNPVKVSRFSPNPYSQLPRDMSKIRHVENPQIQHPGRKTLFFQKRKFRIPLYSSPNSPLHQRPTRFPRCAPKNLIFGKSDFTPKICFPLKNYENSLHKNTDFTEIRPILRKNLYLENPFAAAIVELELH